MINKEWPTILAMIKAAALIEDAKPLAAYGVLRDEITADWSRTDSGCIECPYCDEQMRSGRALDPIEHTPECRLRCRTE